ncbi:MAG TPA: hypothetical protein VGD40_24335 [Chryseosolibacter sp.]
MIRKIWIVALAITASLYANAQQKSDTVVVPLGKSSQIIFTMQDRADVEILKHYNFQEMFQDILMKIENSDSTTAVAEMPPTEEHDTETLAKQKPEDENWTVTRNDEDTEDENETDEEWNRKVERRRGRSGRTWQSFNFDLGTNNYLSNGKFEDTTYTVRPWGSWYLAANSTQRTRIARHFFIEWGVGISWYNFKFQNDDTMLERTDTGVRFITDTRDVNHRKSKLTATYINASFVPVIDLGDRGRKGRMWDGYGSSFRIGFGPYVGYRVASRSKLVYKDDGDLEKEKQRNSFYLSNLRYGARLQLGFHGTDLFFNYDLNELFAEGKGPKLNAFSFGVIF